MSIYAEWKSRCSECGEWIEVGDEICTNTSDEWVHVDCSDIAQ